MAKDTQHRSRLLLAMLAAIALPGPLCAQPTVVLDPQTTRYDIGSHLLLREDADDRHTARTVLAEPEWFQPSTSPEPNLGFTATTYWVQLRLRSAAPVATWVLEIAYPALDRVELYTLTDGVPQVVGLAGDVVPIAEHQTPGRTPRFRMSLALGQEQTYLLRIVSSGYLVLPVRVWEQEAFQQHDRQALLIVGMFLGLMLVMVVYNAMIYVTSRDALYLYYILFVVAHIAFEAGYLGVLHEYLLPTRVGLVNPILIAGATFSVFFATLFTRKFLWQGRSIPWIRILMDVCLAGTIVVTALSFVIPDVPALILVNANLVVYSVIYIALAVAERMRGYTPARVYLVAWFLLLVGVAIMGLRNFRILPSTVITGYSLQVGSVAEVVLLSLALADRISVLRHETAAAEHALRLSRERELKATEEKLYFDPLTGLPNRTRLLSDTGSFSNPVLFLVNVDRFKHINDFYGNRVGDAVLQELRRRIQATPWTRPVSLYRLHADEYAIVAQGDTTPEECVRYGERLAEACHGEPVAVEDQLVRLAVSVGIAREGGPLLEQADMALYEARTAHRSVSVYNPAMQTRKQYENNVRWVGIIRDALNHDRVLPYFQPIRNNTTGAIRKYECLARLVAEDGRIMAPGEFLPMAKASQLYPELSRAVIAKAFRVLADVDSEISINISVEDIEHEETVRVIRDNLRRYRVGERLVFEILESEGIQRYDVVSGFIESMKAEGCTFAIDDFGTGYSNFGHILRLKVDYLKLDASLIRDLDRSQSARAIVRTIHQFAVDLGIETIAEYVHSAAVQAEVERLGLHYSQGFHFGEPRPTIP